MGGWHNHTFLESGRGRESIAMQTLDTDSVLKKLVTSLCEHRTGNTSHVHFQFQDDETIVRLQYWDYGRKHDIITYSGVLFTMELYCTPKSQHTTVKHSQQLFEHTYTSNLYGLRTLTQSSNQSESIAKHKRTSALSDFQTRLTTNQ
jgi:hypothetical protein